VGAEHRGPVIRPIVAFGQSFVEHGVGLERGSAHSMVRASVPKVLGKWLARASLRTKPRWSLLGHSALDFLGGGGGVWRPARAQAYGSGWRPFCASVGLVRVEVLTDGGSRTRRSMGLKCRAIGGFLSNGLPPKIGR